MTDSPPRSRLFRRCLARRRDASSGPAKVKFPETPLILAGALGGPFCIFVLTPFRNALTLASQDAGASITQLYSATFRGGITNGWTGGLAPVLPSCPQFCVMGPLFHFLKEVLGSIPLAVILCACAETSISYGSQTLNAQLAFNREQASAGTGLEVPLWNPFVPYGPGTVVHIARNIVAMSGIRIFSAPCLSLLQRLWQFMGLGELPKGPGQFLGDFIASIGAAMLTAPLNQCYNFAVTSELYMSGDFAEKIQQLSGFLANSYLVYDADGNLTGLSPTLARDLFMRCAYVATLYALFGAIERFAVLIWGSSNKKKLYRTNTVGVRASAP